MWIPLASLLVYNPNLEDLARCLVLDWGMEQRARIGNKELNNWKKNVLFRSLILLVRTLKPSLRDKSYWEWETETHCSLPPWMHTMTKIVCAWGTALSTRDTKAREFTSQKIRVYWAENRLLPYHVMRQCWWDKYINKCMRQRIYYLCNNIMWSF